MNYWLDLFTGTTWNEYRKAGAKVSGFRAKMRNLAGKVKPGDIFLCYLTGVMRWVGAIEVIAPSQDRSRIWKDAEFPVRFEVRPLVLLDPEHGVPMDELEGRVDFSSAHNIGGSLKALSGKAPISSAALRTGY